MTQSTTLTCCRCLKQTDGIHTCMPSAGWRKLEQQRDQLLAALAGMIEAYRPVGSCLYNIGQRHEDWDRVIYPAIEKADKARNLANAAISSVEQQCNPAA